MLHENSIMEIDGCTVFLNRFALTETYELLCKIIEHMAEDLSCVTGATKEEILEDYRYINDFSPIREIMKKEGKWDEEMDKSLALAIMEKKFNNLKNKEN